MFTTLSTIFDPIRTGLTLSLSMERDLLIDEMEIPLVVLLLTCNTLPLNGEHDCCLGLPLEPVAATDDDLTLGTPGRPLEVEDGLSGNEVLIFGGASSEKPGISEGFQCLDFTVGELPRNDIGFFEFVERDFDAEADRTVGADATGTLDGFDG